eukprot:TRINITY_DN2310_c0_g1_i2.p1 TRINITY_DN2310_c0_g1~~TRINITY_DN2310_c0_g1_i2.p1  ORF type:complete len:548 (-),score=87.49 TRINITY_DN2310_c0_g1_i2:130-1773(-)
MGEEANEKCGVFGIYAPELDVSRLAFFALVALQHRGQESCGIATYDKTLGSVHREVGMGLVNQVFNESNLKHLQGQTAIGHTRYSTAGKSTLENAQPVVVQTIQGQIGVVQNGNLTTAQKLRKQLLSKGVGMFKDSDVEIIAQILAANPNNESQTLYNSNNDNSNTQNNHTGNSHTQQENNSEKSENSHKSSSPQVSHRVNWEARISNFMNQADGAYSLCILTPDALFGARDFLGMRPLCIGKLSINKLDGAVIPMIEESPSPENIITRYMLASESCAIKTIGGTFLRDVRPGEIIRIDDSGLNSFVGRKPSPTAALCVFEYVYFSRPDSLLEGQLIHRVRQRLGEQLAIEAPPPPATPRGSGKELCVIGVPDSSLPAAIGFALKMGLPYMEGLCKNRYIHRTFIQPTDQLRKLGISLKFNPLTENIQGRRVIMVDDSIVRGNTIKNIILLIRNAGALEVHVRISSPPIRHPCFMGIDMATYDQLIGHNRTVEEIREFIGADSLGYLSHEGMMTAVKKGLSDSNSEPIGGHCSACFSGIYPVALDDW